MYFIQYFNSTMCMQYKDYSYVHMATYAVKTVGVDRHVFILTVGLPCIQFNLTASWS